MRVLNHHPVGVARQRTPASADALNNSIFINFSKHPPHRKETYHHEASINYLLIFVWAYFTCIIVMEVKLAMCVCNIKKKLYYTSTSDFSLYVTKSTAISYVMDSAKLPTYEYLDRPCSKLSLLQRKMWKSLGHSLFA